LSSFGAGMVQKKLTIRGPTGNVLVVTAAFDQSFFGARAVRELPVKIEWTRPAGAEDETAAIRRPHRIPVLARIERELSPQAVARQIVDPDVSGLPGWVEHAHGDARPVRRQLQCGLICFFTNRTKYLAVSIEPHELRIDPSRRRRSIRQHACRGY